MALPLVLCRFRRNRWKSILKRITSRCARLCKGEVAMSEPAAGWYSSKPAFSARDKYKSSE
jgi:hypothetical protein